MFSNVTPVTHFLLYAEGEERLSKKHVKTYRKTRVKITDSYSNSYVLNETDRLRFSYMLPVLTKYRTISL